MVANEMTLTQLDLTAGADYLRALRRLQLEPDVMCWTYVLPITDGDIDPTRPADKHLAVVTSIVDYSGPTAMYDLLFKAYDASITPKEIDPFIVTLYSPDSIGGQILLSASKTGQISEARDFFNRKNGNDKNAIFIGSNFDPPVFINIILEGVYVAHKRPIAADRSETRFRTFKKSVDRLAA